MMIDLKINAGFLDCVSWKKRCSENYMLYLFPGNERHQNGQSRRIEFLLMFNVRGILILEFPEYFPTPQEALNSL